MFVVLRVLSQVSMSTGAVEKVAHRGLSQLHGILLGAGSNAVDMLFGVRGLPSSGSKSYFQAHAASESVGGKHLLQAPLDVEAASNSIAGVVLNHLGWSRMLNTPAALMALQVSAHCCRRVDKPHKTYLAGR